MCSFDSQQNATDASIEGVCNWQLTAGMSSRSVARALNVHFFAISRLQRVSENMAVHPTGLTTADHV